MLPVFDPLYRYLRDSLEERYREKYGEKRSRLLAEMFLSAATLAVLGLVALVIHLTAPMPTVEPLDKELRAQERRLDDVQSSLRDLSKFIERQRSEVRGAQQTLSALQKERSDLEPFVKTNRAYVDGILKLQGDQLREEAKQQRWRGFVDGIISSIAATIIVSLCALGWKWFRSKSHLGHGGPTDSEVSEDLVQKS